jgi:hypothetical protein
MAEMVEFIRVQLDDEAAEARKQSDSEEYGYNGYEIEASGATGYPCERFLRIAKVRVLREVEVKRRILDAYERWSEAKVRHTRAVAELDADIEHQERTGEWTGAGFPDVRQRAVRREADYLDAMQPVLVGLIRAVGAVYAGHQDYRQEWRPE